MHFHFLLPLLSLPFTLSDPHSDHQSLKWDVYLVPPVPTAPLSANLSFSPTAITLLHARDSAILIDAPTNINATEALADWIEATIPGKKLTHVYITHGHGDHFFGVPVLQKRFPGLVALATGRTIKHIAQQIEPTFFEGFWEVAFPGGQIPKQDEVFTTVPRVCVEFVQRFPQEYKRNDLLTAFEERRNLSGKLLAESGRSWSKRHLQHNSFTRAKY